MLVAISFLLTAPAVAIPHYPWYSGWWQAGSAPLTRSQHVQTGPQPTMMPATVGQETDAVLTGFVPAATLTPVAALASGPQLSQFNSLGRTINSAPIKAAETFVPPNAASFTAGVSNTGPFSTRAGPVASSAGSAVASNSNPTAASPVPGAKYTGDITFYDVGLGSCGQNNTDQDPICALSWPMMNNGPNPNTNPKCHKFITLMKPGNAGSVRAEVVDSCQGCAFADVDLSPALFSQFAPAATGRLSGIVWSFD